MKLSTTLAIICMVMLIVSCASIDKKEIDNMSTKELKDRLTKFYETDENNLNTRRKDDFK